MKSFEVGDSFYSDGDRKAFLIYETEVRSEAIRLRNYTN